jgi:hypothetical protein
MSPPEITQAERVRWQRRAARQLVAILDAHPGLPPIAWTVGAAGSMLTGHVNGLATPNTVRATFAAWRHALPLADHSVPASGSGSGVGCSHVTQLSAAGELNRVRVALTATVFHDEETDGQHAGRVRP